MIFRIVSFHHLYAGENFMNLGSDYRCIFKRTFRPLAHSSADCHNGHDKYRESHNNHKKSRQHLIGDGEVKDIPYGNDDFKRSKSKFRKDLLDDNLHLMGICRAAAHKLPYIYTPKKLHRLFIHMAENIASEIRYDMTARPGKTVMVQKHKPHTQQSH